MACESVENLRIEKTKEFFSQMKAWGLDEQTTKEYIKEWLA